MLRDMFPGLPSSAVIVLAGISGSGKSSWAQKELPGSHILSSDTFRGVLTDDEEHQGCSHDAFDVLETLADLRLKYQRLAVIDATNLKRQFRRKWLALAEKHKVPAVVVWFDTPPEVCARRQLLRERQVPAEVIGRQARVLADLPHNLVQEDWDAIIRVRTGVGAGAAQGSGALTFETLREWRAPAISPAGPQGVRVNRTDIDVIGDVHGCFEELTALMTKLGWQRDGDSWSHPDDRFLIFVGDLTDRGPNSIGVLDLVERLVEEGKGLLVLGNHDDKLRRWLKGNNVKLAHGLETTTAEFAALEPEDLLAAQRRFGKLLASSPMWALCDPQPGDGRPIPERLVIAHAAWKPSLMGASAGKVRSLCLYGPNTGNTVNGLPQRLDWKPKYPENAPMCVVGHTAFDGPVVVRHNTICLDTACVFGGHLSAMRWPSGEIVQEKARRTYCEKGELPSAPNLIDPKVAKAMKDAPKAEEETTITGRREIPSSIAERVATMVQIGPDETFELDLGVLLQQIHDEPEKILRRVEADEKLLKREPVEGELKGLVLANASKLLFSPEHTHQIYAKGLIYKRNPWKAVSIPYLKMYNYGERQDAFDLANTLASDESITIRYSEKLDGTMLQTFSTAGHDQGEPRVVLTTRGMLEGAALTGNIEANFDYLGQSREILSEQTPAALDPARVEGLTLLWEMIHPGSRIVTDYGDRREVVLTGAIDFRDGPPRYLPRPELESLGQELGAPVAATLEFPGDTLAEKLEALAQSLEGTDREGAVITFEGPDGQGRPSVRHRVKVKGSSYLRLMRLFAYCTYDRTREFLEANPELKTWEQFRDFLMRQGSDEVPEEVLGTYRSHFKVWLAYQGVCQTIAKEAKVTYDAYNVENPRPSRDTDLEGYKVWRKDYAAWAKSKARDLAWLLFALADDRLTPEYLDRKFRGNADEAQTVRDAWRSLV